MVDPLSPFPDSSSVRFQDALPRLQGARELLDVVQLLLHVQGRR